MSGSAGRKASATPTELGTTSDLVRASERLQAVAQSRIHELDDWQLERSRLIQEHSWLRSMVDNLPDYLFVKDRSSRFVIANRAVALDLGLQPEDVIGKTDMELHPSERATEFLGDERRVLRTGQPMIDKEEYILLPSGEQRWLSTSKLPLRDPSGEVIALVGVSRDITRRKHAEDQVRILAYYDSLTALPNRAAFEMHLEHVAQALRPDDEASLLLIDLDRFKHVNDTLGHAAGDELLKAVAGRLLNLVGSKGHVARIGGDEFVIVRRFKNSAREVEFCNELVQTLATFTLMGNTVHVGASVGLTKLHRLTTPMSALREADIALYEAKARGRNGWCSFEARMAERLERRHQLEADLRLALPAGEQIAADFQPIFSADGMHMVGAEALVRWDHPSYGRLMPDKFVSIAEECGVIGALGEVVLRRACALLERTTIPWVAINVSPLQLREQAFVERLLATIADFNVAPARLQLEITEGVFVGDFAKAKAVLDRLRWLGVRIAIDDFGTGYSSLSYLAGLSVDKIKVDRSFVSQIGSANGNAIVQAVIAFARALNLAVTAEGVETEEQRCFLASAGCDETQGFLLSRPLPEAKIATLLHGQA